MDPCSGRQMAMAEEEDIIQEVAGHLLDLAGDILPRGEAVGPGLSSEVVTQILAVSVCATAAGWWSSLDSSRRADLLARQPTADQ